MTTKHTPGPWKFCRSNEDFDGPMFDVDPEDELLPITRIEAKGKVIAEAHDLFEFREANARLIAAAPDLLEALQEFLRNPGGDHTEEIAEAAIAKATGAST